MGVTIGLLGLAILLSSGYSVWKKGNGLTSFGESALYVESLAKSETGGAYAVNRELGQVTGTSHLLSQIFLAGPLMLLNAATRFASLISSKGDLEKRMGEVLERSRDANKWQDLKEYVGVEEELQNLIRIGAIQYGISRGVPRIKINKNYGN